MTNKWLFSSSSYGREVSMMLFICSLWWRRIKRSIVKVEQMQRGTKRMER